MQLLLFFFSAVFQMQNKCRSPCIDLDQLEARIAQKVSKKRIIQMILCPHVPVDFLSLSLG